ncbi:hypothetical protein C1Y63_01250 [Corynebacterium sp. 13CS0277]|uniref:FeoA family protein n=1 Tax=Corynebacterium sp. 13CS0277 TaxID=2071994 RepID=UPI000D02A7C8|nr:FeoA family protein [Corynebacterium sp. 13CS0277]PRQ12447.1 hypothetical protein C1Y63_01250 [Corynebacterium sp. 13CS0277]
MAQQTPDAVVDPRHPETSAHPVACEQPHGWEEEFSLATVPLGRRCEILGVSVLEDALRRRLAELGIRPGMAVSVTQRTSGGGRVIKVGDTRYALDKLTARALRVRPAREGR